VEKKERITVDIFNHMVDLAALELDPKEAEYLRRELNNQLKAIDELEAIPLGDDVEPTSHGIHYTSQISPELRDDDWLPFPNPEDIINQAPDTEERYIVVPDIPHEDLE
jgi:aspartyl/glutamyl-tRNA(Asn/Gln) amidotransferase C subunit